jgi:mannose-1-phosphate guanylyltransferase
MSTPRIFPVILAGGASSRLWPASANNRPKWDLRLFAPENSTENWSLLQSTFARGLKVAPAADCFVVTAASQAELIASSLPELPRANILVEPEMRDTAGAVAYAAGAIAKRLLEQANASTETDRAVMLVLPGDHVIRDLDRFAVCARTAATAAVDLCALMTFGIVPRAPVTGYGYVHRGTPVSVKDLPAQAPGVYTVAAFKEKPDRETAEQYVRSGDYYWNGGIFAWQLTTLREEFHRQLPDHAAMVEALATSGDNWDAVARTWFPKLKKTSIDFGIMEHAQQVATIDADFDWDDIGSWSAVGPHLLLADHNRVAEGSHLFSLDASDNVVFAPGKRVALVGVEGLAVVQQGDDLLICRLDRDQDVKKISQMAQAQAAKPTPPTI